MPEITKTPAESYFEHVYHFGSDAQLRDSFINSFGDLRFGKLLEEMDLAAGKISYAHADGFDLDLTIVTAACDRIDLVAPLPSNQDLRLLGQVNEVGNSSMEVGLRLETLEDGVWKFVARAYFIMVALKGDRGFKVHRLSPESGEEQRRSQDAALRSQRRRVEMKSNFRHSAPTAEESGVLHELFLSREAAHHKGLDMADTWRQTTMIMHPQNRNIHHKVFGGHIMRLSFETAYNVAHLYCRRRPLFVCVDHFDFLKPVEIGSIVSFNGLVTYTGNTSFIVEVTAEVLDPISGGRSITNISNFTFVAVDEDCGPMPVPKVFPHSYKEGLKYLDGAKRYQAGKDELERRNRT